MKYSYPIMSLGMYVASMCFFTMCVVAPASGSLFMINDSSPTFNSKIRVMPKIGQVSDGRHVIATEVFADGLHSIHNHTKGHDGAEATVNAGSTKQMVISRPSFKSELTRGHSSSDGNQMVRGSTEKQCGYYRA